MAIFQGGNVQLVKPGDELLIKITDILCPNCGESYMIREGSRIIKSNTQRYTYSCPDCGFVHTAKSDKDMEEEILREQVRAFMGIVKETTEKGADDDTIKEGEDE